MPNPLTALDRANGAYAESVKTFETARAAYLLSVEKTNSRIMELNHLDAQIRAGDASGARKRLDVKAEVEALKQIAEVHDQAVRAAVRRRDAAYAAVVAENRRASSGAMKSVPAIRALELEAQGEIDQILFKLADDIAAHNKELGVAVDAILATQSSGGVHPSVQARSDSSAKMLVVDGVEYRELSPSFVLGNAVGHPEDRWRSDRDAHGMAARRAEHERRATDDAKLAEERSDARGAAYAVEARASKRKA